ncbi:hypothetical protein GCM10023216_23140 [Isoptericola chiayiensis]|uniref:Uncharacterized protein n=1 Tax=Isoptericola chiayiensis TaxID=579446 RepID=A0ABP8YKV2_9MICO|nr:hypothetical protein [Isoptericola chiayiensis]
MWDDGDVGLLVEELEDQQLLADGFPAEHGPAGALDAGGGDGDARHSDSASDILT